MALDFNETYMKRLNESFDLIANGVQYTWPGVGGMTIMNGGISWHSGNWSLYGGGSVVVSLVPSTLVPE